MIFYQTQCRLWLDKDIGVFYEVKPIKLIGHFFCDNEYIQKQSNYALVSSVNQNLIL